MTFAALSTWQAWLLMGAAAALAAWIFYLKVRPPRHRTPSLLMWSRVMEETRERSWWERVRRAVSLVVTVLVALALASALARPGPRASADAIIIVLDSSWSMAAASTAGGTRWDHAIAEARSLARSAGGDITVATTAAGIVSGPTPDSSLIERALARLEPGGDISQWPQPIHGEAVHFITDGGVVRPLDASVIVHSVFRPASNVGVTAFDVRPALSIGSPARAYVEIANFSPQAQRVRLTMTREAMPVIDREIDIAGGELVRRSVDLSPTGGPRLHVHVSAPDNALQIDDDAAAWLGASDPVDVEIVSRRPDDLAGVLARYPGVRIHATLPARYRPSDADLVIFEEWLPATPPAQPMLVIAPPPAAWLSSSAGVTASVPPASLTSHPVVAGVDPMLLGLTSVETVTVEGAVAAASKTGAPLVAIQDRADRRLVHFGFQVDAAVRTSPAFAVLLGNAVEWLARPAGGPPRPTGLVEFASSVSRVTSPDGQPVPLTRVGDRVIARLTHPGLYLAHAGGSRSVVAVNAGGVEVSNLQLTATPPTAADEAPPVAARAWWIYGVFLALILLTVEWWTWQRRITV